MQLRERGNQDAATRTLVAKDLAARHWHRTLFESLTLTVAAPGDAVGVVGTVRSRVAPDS